MVVLSDNIENDKYLYEVIVFTGSRKDAGTDSTVCLFVIEKSIEQIFEQKKQNISFNDRLRW